MSGHGTGQGGRLERSVERFLSDTIPQLKDPRIPLVVTVERVRFSGDMSQAKVLVTTLGDEEAQREMLEALNRASGYLQRELGNFVEMRRTPRLSFHINPLDVM